jgi:autotransporter-associated beta strand protein
MQAPCFLRFAAFPSLSLFFSVLCCQSAPGASARWNPEPISSDWQTPMNWIPANVPNSANDTAIFGVSNLTEIENAGAALSSMIFQPGASSYIITTNSPQIFEIGGDGIVNNSGLVQKLLVPEAVGQDAVSYLFFINTANAGSLTELMAAAGNDRRNDTAAQIHFNENSGAGSATVTNSSSSTGGTGAETHFFDKASAENAMIFNLGGPELKSTGAVYFHDNSSAGNATIDLAAAGYGAFCEFQNQATAGSATIINRSGQTIFGGATIFSGSSTAGEAIIINEGAPGQGPGNTLFISNSTAGNATLIANGSSSEKADGGIIYFQTAGSIGAPRLIANAGTGSGNGGSIRLQSNSTAENAHVELSGNGRLEIDFHFAPGVTVGSLEGEGSVILGSNNLGVGSTNQSTTFTGVIDDAGFGGALTKLGSGRLVLTNAHTYTGGTIVAGGILLINNTSGSGTGSGPVFALAGTLGGSGVIAGAVVVGTGNGAGVILGPGESGVSPGTLTIQKRLALKADATYRVALRSSIPAADQVTAKGVTIRGAQILVKDFASSVLPPGTVFTVINNTAATPISGTFANLADGSTVVAGSNTFEADYEGGDGNDLTLTVVP